MLHGRRDQVTATFRGRNIAVIRDCLASTGSNAIGHLFRDRGILPEPRYLGPQVRFRESSLMSCLRPEGEVRTACELVRLSGKTIGRTLVFQKEPACGLLRRRFCNPTFIFQEPYTLPLTGLPFLRSL